MKEQLLVDKKNKTSEVDREKRMSTFKAIYLGCQPEGQSAANMEHKNN